MRKAAIALFFGVAMTPHCALATDWIEKGTLSEAVELNDNQFLKTMMAGGSLGSYSGITTDLEGKSASSTFDFSSDTTYQKYWGPGIEGLQSEYITYDFKARYQQFGKTPDDREYFEASYGQQSAALAAFNTLGLPPNATGYLNQVKVLGGIDRAVSAVDTFSLRANSVYTSYDPSNGGTPFTDTLASGSWKHFFNSTAALTESAEAEYLSYDNLVGTDAIILRNLVGFDVKLTPVLAVRGAVGPSYLQLNNGFGAPVVPGLPAISKSNTAADLLANLHVTYNLTKTATFNFEAFRTVGPTILGSILTQTTGRTGFEFAIDPLSSLSVYVNYSRLVSPTTTDFASATLQYETKLTETLTGKIQYNYIHRFTTTGDILFDPVTGIPSNLGLGPANSNGILMVLSKSFVAHVPGG